MSTRKPEHSVKEERQRVIERILEKVDIYYKTFGKGIPLRALTTSFIRTLSRFGPEGDFVATYTQLQKDGSIFITMHEITAARTVYPWHADMDKILKDKKFERLT